MTTERGSRRRGTTRHSSYYDLRDALAMRGCPLCRLIARVSERHLDFLLWERVMDPDLRRELRQSRGFCREHGWALVRPGASLAVAILMQDVLQDIMQSLDAATRPPAVDTRGRLVRLRETIGTPPPPETAEISASLEPRADGVCPVCAQCHTMEAIYLDVLLEHLTGPDNLYDAYVSSDGLCLPHLRRAVPRARSQAALGALLQAQRSVWERLSRHLCEVIRKNDYRFQDEPWGEEADAWVRSVAALVGQSFDANQPRRATTP